MQVGADSVAEVTRGLPERLTGSTTESSGLSGGAIAVIVIVIVLVLVFITVGGVLGGCLYYSKSRKGKYYITETAGGPEPKFISNNVTLEDRTDIGKLGVTNSIAMTEITQAASTDEDTEHNDEDKNTKEATKMDDRKSSDNEDSSSSSSSGSSSSSSDSDSSDNEEHKSDVPEDTSF